VSESEERIVSESKEKRLRESKEKRESPPKTRAGQLHAFYYFLQ